MTRPEDVLAFWLDELSPADWYRGSDTLDASIREKFLTTWQQAEEGGLGLWLTYPSGCLAYIILTDQFPRNMFRGDARSFKLDRVALAAAKVAIARGWDKRIDVPARQFFYMPLMHSEILCDQDRCVRLMHERMGKGDGSNLLHARVHREIIRKLGRFPYRNEALGRETNAAERAFMDAGGYQNILNSLQAEMAA